ncbi:MAG: translation elongation factor Ts [Christensenellales bacterium]
MFTAEDVKELRNRTNAGMMDCKKALEECDGNMEKAAEYLREKGMAAAAKKSGRIAAEGVVQSYIHMGGKIGVLVEVNCETDFVARSEQFLSFVKDVAMQIAAANPRYVTEAEVPSEEVEKEREIIRIQTLNEGKPANVVDRIVDGRISKFYSEICLLNQAFVKDPSITVNELVNKMTLALGEKISIRRFTRYEMGEGIEKRKDDFVNEVLGQIKA